MQSSSVPPGQPDKKRVGASSSRKAGCFRIEEEPFRGIVKSISSFSREGFISQSRKKFQRHRRRFGIFGSGKPVVHREVLTEMIACYAGPEELGEDVFLSGSAERSFFAARGS